MLSGKNKGCQEKLNMLSGKNKWLSQEKYDVRKNNNAKEKMSGKNMVSGKKINVVRKK